MITVTAYRDESGYSFDARGPERSVVTLVLAEGVRPAMSATGERLLYREGFAYGLSILAALQTGWCWEVETAGEDGSPADARRTRRLAAPPLVEATLPGAVLDLSRGGIGLFTHMPPTAGERRRIVLRDPITDETHPAEAEVVWSQGKRAGLRWVGSAPEPLLQAAR